MLADPSIPQSVQQQVVSSTEEGLPMVFQAHARGLPRDALAKEDGEEGVVLAGPSAAGEAVA